MRARSGMSVHREDAQRDAEAREAGFAVGINAALAWLIDRNRTDVARQMRADFVDQPQHQETAA
jgi:hypothetical protein